MFFKKYRYKKFVILTLFVVLFTLKGLAKDYLLSYVSGFKNINHPQILLWSFDAELLEQKKYLLELENIADRTPFDLVMLSARKGMSFYEFDKMRPVFKELLDKAHASGIKIGIQFWPNVYEQGICEFEKYRGRTTNSVTVPLDQAQGVIIDGQCELDKDGRALYTGKAHGYDGVKTLHSDVFRVYLLKKTAEGFYKPGSLEDITNTIQKSLLDSKSVQIKIDAGKTFAGYTAFIMTVHYYNYGDLFGSYLLDSFGEALAQYADIPFDGTALDEFGYMRTTQPWRLGDQVFRGRLYSKNFSQHFERKTGESLERILLEMRYVPESHSNQRIRAINTYMACLRDGPLRIEKAFYEMSKIIFGPDTFVGEHNTFHNDFNRDEIWNTVINWWDLPREYGQCDEHVSPAARMGMLYSYPQPILYNMYYHKNPVTFYKKAILDAKYNVRLHYHAYGDTRWGYDFKDQQFIEIVNKIEKKIRLLNRFNPPLPKINLLTVFGFEALANWYPNVDDRSTYDINDKLDILDKADQIWNAGYHNVLVPSYSIENGRLKLDKDNRPLYNGHTFDAIVFLHPQYSQPATIEFLEHYVDRGGKLMIEGTATHDFYGDDVTDRFSEIYKNAVCDSFSLKGLSELAVRPSNIPQGCLMQDGSVVFTDLASIETKRSSWFRVNIDGDIYEGPYIGVAAILANKGEGLKKFVCGGFGKLLKNGKVIFSLDSPADIFMQWSKSGTWNILINDPDRAITPGIFDLAQFRVNK